MSTFLETPQYALKLSCGLFAFALFVVIITTPEEPLIPYMAAEVASFKIVMSTMSSVFIPLISKVWMPSTTYKGLTPDAIELFPLIFTFRDCPGFPEFCTTLTPAALPCKACPTL